MKVHQPCCLKGPQVALALGIDEHIARDRRVRARLLSTRECRYARMQKREQRAEPRAVAAERNGHES